MLGFDDSIKKAKTTKDEIPADLSTSFFTGNMNRCNNKNKLINDVILHIGAAKYPLP